MIALAFTLLAGRYHATGWDHHVNEGTVEWPPSPWRVLRALVAASYRLGPDLDRPRLAAILERLATPPVYYLPDAAPGHLRHYMPIDGASIIKVFDTFLALGHGAADPPELIVAWPDLDLDPADRDLLASVAVQIAYLGRAESWAECRLRDVLPARQPDASPLAPGDNPRARTRLLAPLGSLEYRAWRDGYLAAQPPRQRARLRLPDTLWDVLNLDTGALQQSGWSIAPGTRWIHYTLTEPPAPPQRTAPTRSDWPDFVRIILDSAVHPSIKDALWIGERLRAALLSRVGDRPCPVLTGKDDAGKPLRDHGHAYFLPQSGKRGEVDQILVYARRGFDPVALHALHALRELHGLTSHPTYTTIVALGRRDHLERPHPQLRPATRWRTLTPFVPPRCPEERHGQLRNSPSEQLRRLCHLIHGVEPVAVRPFTPEESRRQHLHDFRRQRQRGAAVPGNSPGLGFHLEFAAPIAGPLALGYGAHFGLGQFSPID